MKIVNDVLAKLKGAGNESKTLTGKASFSKSGFSDITNALANDTTYKVNTYNKDGTTTAINLSELIRNDIMKTVAKAGYPQASEKDVFKTAEIITTGLSQVIPFIVREQIATGKKFDIPATKDLGGSIYLAPVKGKTKTVPVRDIKTREERGSTTITTKDSIQIRAKSPVPKHLQTKVRRDTSGNVVK